MQAVLSKTLIIRFSSVGDIVLSTPLVRLLRKRFPHCQIDYLTRSDYAELLRTNPHISALLEFPAGGSLHDLHRHRRAIRSSDYDVIIDIHGSLRSRFLTFGMRDVRRINKRKFARWVLVHLKRDFYSRLGGSPGITQRYLETAHSLGISDDGKGTEVFVPEEAALRAARLLQTPAADTPPLLIGFCPSARHETKQWLKERFAQTAAVLGKDLNAGILLFGSASESARCAEIRTQILELAPETLVLDLSGRLTLMETAAAMDRCSLIISNDSGLMHLAAARKRRLVAVFGSTTRQLGFFPPDNLSTVVENPVPPCRPCSHIGRSSCPEGHFDCMKGISVSEVLDAARKQLKH
jgi:lipopolysaccharide heptosyltransferase II